MSEVIEKESTELVALPAYENSLRQERLFA